MTQNSTPPSHSACSSSAEKIYRSDVESIEGWYFLSPSILRIYYRLDLRKCSPLSTSFSSHQLEAEKREIEDRNIVYREKFPKVREQIESKLLEFYFPKLPLEFYVCMYVGMHLKLIGKLEKLI